MPRNASPAGIPSVDIYVIIVSITVLELATQRLSAGRLSAMAGITSLPSRHMHGAGHLRLRFTTGTGGNIAIELGAKPSVSRSLQFSWDGKCASGAICPLSEMIDVFDAPLSKLARLVQIEARQPCCYGAA